MHKVTLKNTGLIVSKIGLGTGTSGFTGNIVQAQMGAREFAAVLLYGFEKGINFWDTAYSYGTYRHIAEAMGQIKRREVVVSSKFTSSTYGKVKREVEETLRELKTDYIDIGLMHGIRNSFELSVRNGALKALLEAKRKGYIRHVGLSSHGLGALSMALENRYMEIVFGRLNPFGAYMDSLQEDILSKLVAIPLTRMAARALIPKRLLPSISARIEAARASKENINAALKLFRKLDSAGKPVIAMKVIGAGSLKDRAEESLSFVLATGSVSSAVIGIISKKEVDGLIDIYNRSTGEKTQ